MINQKLVWNRGKIYYFLFYLKLIYEIISSLKENKIQFRIIFIFIFIFVLVGQILISDWAKSMNFYFSKSRYNWYIIKYIGTYFMWSFFYLFILFSMSSSFLPIFIFVSISGKLVLNQDNFCFSEIGLNWCITLYKVWYFKNLINFLDIVFIFIFIFALINQKGVWNWGKRYFFLFFMKINKWKNFFLEKK